MLKRIPLHGENYVTYDPDEYNISYGISYLRNKEDQAHICFNEAKEKGETTFEDSEGRNFNLIYQKKVTSFLSDTVYNFVLSTRRNI